MTTINLKDFYYWYLTDVLVEVPDEVAEELIASKRREAAHAERVRYNKAYYSLDCDDGIEYSACLHEPSPQELMDRKELFFRLWNALNSLPEIQGRRVDAHLILGKSYRQIAREEGVDKSAVRCSVKCGIERIQGAAAATFASCLAVFLVRTVSTRRLLPFSLSSRKLVLGISALLVQTAFILLRWPGWIAAQALSLTFLFLLGLPAILSTAQVVLHRK